MIDFTKGRFTGHQTFAYRYTWAPKVYEVLQQEHRNGIFDPDDAIVSFGVGKNMVGAIQHWTQASGLIEPDYSEGAGWRMTPFGNAILGKLDPHLERSETPWLLHWNLTRTENAAIISWLFNYHSGIEFSPQSALMELRDFLKKQGVRERRETTLHRDMECVLRTYVRRGKGKREEDDLESPLVGLSLIEPTSLGKTFVIRRLRRDSLTGRILTFALLDYWREEHSSAASVSFEAAMYRPGSPGMAFRLSEEHMEHLAPEIEEVTKGRVRWSETAGLRQWQLAQREEVPPPSLNAVYWR